MCEANKEAALSTCEIIAVVIFGVVFAMLLVLGMGTWS